MEPLKKLSAAAAYLDASNIDTDAIIPKQFLKTLSRKGLGQYLFFDLRYDEKGKDIPDFTLNTDRFKGAKVLFAGENFGCGSSREHAVWALLDYGIKVVIAPSFAEIFHDNCFNNGVAPITLPEEVIKKAINDLKDEKRNNTKVEIDLESMLVTTPDGKSHSFKMDDFQRMRLMEGLDTIELTLKSSEDISTYEKQTEDENAWRFIAK